MPESRDAPSAPTVGQPTTGGLNNGDAYVNIPHVLINSYTSDQPIGVRPFVLNTTVASTAI